MSNHLICPRKETPLVTLRQPRILAALFSLGAVLGLFVPARAVETPSTPIQPPTGSESKVFQDILDRLQQPENAPNMPVPVTDVVRSLDEAVTKTFTGRDGKRSVRVTVRIRTRHIHWDPTYEGDSEWYGGHKVVGRYSWRLQTRTRQTRSNREITVYASNTIMLDDRNTAEGERDTLGRIGNESLMYHELLHGQLLINAMDDPQWRTRLMTTRQIDTSGSDGNHRWIYDLQARYLLGRGGRYAYTVPPEAASTGETPGSFSMVIGRVPTGYVGSVTGEFHTLVHGNVDGLRIHVENQGPDRGRVTLTGKLKDLRRGGFFLAVIDPVIRTASPPPESAAV